MSFPHRKDTRPGTTPGQSDLSEVVQWLKMTTHRMYSEGVRRSGWVEYHGLSTNGRFGRKGITITSCGMTRS